MSHALSFPSIMTVDEFLEWPGDHINRLHALIDGVPVAMNPGAVPHAVLCANLATDLNIHLRARRLGCFVLSEPGVQPRAGAATNVRIPDLAVACGPIGTKLLTNPLIVIEILSPSNRSETREAVRACLSIPTLQEVLIVDSTAIRAETLAREPDGSWPADPTTIGPDGEIVLNSIGFRLPLVAIYSGTALED